MIRTNLSTRPFYNERAVRLGLFALAVIVAVATVFNVARVMQYSQSDTALGSQASRDEAQSADLHAQAVRLRGTVDPRQIEYASTEARQANDLIDRRTFSWTELFNHFETTLPDEVRLTSVRPKLDPKRGIVLIITVVARSVANVSQLMENLEATGAFTELLPFDHINDEGLLEATIETTYTPANARRGTSEANPR